MKNKNKYDHSKMWKSKTKSKTLDECNSETQNKDASAKLQCKSQTRKPKIKTMVIHKWNRMNRKKSMIIFVSDMYKKNQNSINQIGGVEKNAEKKNLLERLT